MSIGSTIYAVVCPSLNSITLALSFLGLAYASAIAERQLRSEDDDKNRDCALHAKVDELLRGVPDADVNLVAIEQRGDPKTTISREIPRISGKI